MLIQTKLTTAKSPIFPAFLIQPRARPKCASCCQITMGLCVARCSRCLHSVHASRSPGWWSHLLPSSGYKTRIGCSGKRGRSRFVGAKCTRGGDSLSEGILVLSLALVLFLWGILSFHNLPIEAYPDVADTYTQIITQWPGHAAEEIEQQITIPLEVTLNGVAHMAHLRSVSLAGLSVITIIYDDEISTFNARTEVIDRLQQVTLPNGVSPALGPDYSPTGQIMFYTLTSTN